MNDISRVAGEGSESMKRRMDFSVDQLNAGLPVLVGIMEWIRRRKKR